MVLSFINMITSNAMMLNRMLLYNILINYS